MATLATHAGGAVAVSPALQLVFDGTHNAKLWHEGPFTTSAAFCPSGYATDVEVNDATLTSVRRFSCSGGDEFTARVTSLRAEHGGSGTWQILGGTGALADLRGQGGFESLRLSGSPDDPASITFKSTWSGVADLDVQGPKISIVQARARKLARPKGSLRLRLAVSLEDAGGRIAYDLVVKDPRDRFSELASKQGVAPSGRVNLVLRISGAGGLRAVRLQFDATDPVGNHSSLVKAVRVSG